MGNAPVCVEQNTYRGQKLRQMGQENKTPSSSVSLLLSSKAGEICSVLALITIGHISPNLLSTAPFCNQGQNPLSFLLLPRVSLVSSAHEQIPNGKKNNLTRQQKDQSILVPCSMAGAGSVPRWGGEVQEQRAGCP